MNLGLVRELCEKRAGGMRQLAYDIGMSEANLHRCVNNNKIQAADLEQIAIKLKVDIRLFFSEETIALSNNTDTIICNCESSTNESKELIELCKSLVANYQQRDDVMSKLVSMVKRIE